MYSFPNLEPVHCSMFGSNCCFLTCIQISQEAGEMIWYSHLLKNFPQFVVIHTVKGFSVVNEAEMDIFLEFSCFFNDPTDVGNFIFDSSAFSKSSMNIWKFFIYVLLKPCLENFEHYWASLVAQMSEHYWASLVAQMVKCLPTMQETQVQSLGREDPLGEEMAAHSVFLPEKFRGQKSLMGYSPWGCNELNTTERLNTYIDK